MKIINPVLKGFNPDPAICRVGEDYYIAVSTFEWFPGVQIHHSKDLINWRLVANPLNRVSQLNMMGNPDSGGVWAPALTHHDGQFWLIYSDVKQNMGPWKEVKNYLVTCETIDGQWSEPIYMNGSGFDPSLFHDEDGRKWFVNMIWDHRRYKHPFGGIILQEYCHKSQKLIGPKKNIFAGTDIGLVEAPHLYRANGYYYLITAEGGTKWEHAVTVARSKNIDGPYELHPQNPILTSYFDPHNPLQKAGHASMIQTPEGEWYLAHLMGRPFMINDGKWTQNRGFCPLGRETSIQKLYWKNDWPYVVGGNSPSVEVEAPNVASVVWEKTYPVRDEFKNGKLNHHFNTLRVPFEGFGSLTDRPGYLRLYGKGSPTTVFTQAMVARRWQSFYFRAETKVFFTPENFQQQAGLMNYYNTANWNFFHVTANDAGQRVLDIMFRDNGPSAQPLGEAGQIVIPEGVEGVTLRVDVAKETYQYSYSFDGENFVAIPMRFESHKLSDDYIQNAGFFTGAFVGMHCVDVSGDDMPADFEYFLYDEGMGDV